MKEEYNETDLFCLPLHSSLPHNVQMQVFIPSQSNQRKVIVSTNVAETSITIEGIKYVVDCGYVKMKYFDFYSGIEVLATTAVSKAASKQRAGRAGRTQYGKCFRLMTQATFNTLLEFSPPEMQRSDISWSILQLKALGIDDVLHFDFLSPPPAEAMIYGLELLYSLGAINIQNQLTTIGLKMSEMPVEPRLAKSLLMSYDFGCSEEMLSIAAMCSVEYPFINIRNNASKESKQRLMKCIYEFVHYDGDHMTLLNIYNAYVLSDYNSQWCQSMSLQYKILARAHELRNQMKRMLIEYAPEGIAMASCGDDTDAIRRCIVSGYFANAAQLKSDGNYHTVRGNRSVTPHHTSIYTKFGTPPEWVIFNDVLHTNVAEMREVCKIDPRWLLELAHHFYTSK